ncbi:MAG: hypothetical protein RBS43_09540, partial [Candidatus Cloacimonas sp.]|nr:hypothetical protein [Candidatus Cloacimonas sp.]
MDYATGNFAEPNLSYPVARVLTQIFAAKVITVCFVSCVGKYLSQIRSFGGTTLGACLTYIFVPQTPEEKQ